MADNVVLLQQWPTPKREIEVSLRPATPCELDVFIAALQSWMKKSPAIEDPKAFWQAMREDVAKYPIDVLMGAAKQARGLRGFNWTPSIKEMVELCEHLMEPRRVELRAIHRAESDRRAREQEAVERAAEAEREAERQREREAYRQAEIERLRKLEAGACKRFGDDGPLPGDVELAVSLSNSTVYRARVPISWQAALADGEDWAAQYCRLMALAARVIRAHDQGQVSLVGSPRGRQADRRRRSQRTAPDRASGRAPAGRRGRQAYRRFLVLPLEDQGKMWARCPRLSEG
jgi:hypothetical protein